MYEQVLRNVIKKKISSLSRSQVFSLSLSLPFSGGLFGPRIPNAIIGAFIAHTMAEATRSKTSADHWEEAFARLSSSKFDELLHRMTQLETEHASPRVPSPSPGATTTNPTYRMKLEVSRFNGSDPEGWIFKITQFFEYHATPDHERLTIASFYMEGLALAWFQWMHRNGQLSSWSTFLHAIHARFLSSTYEDPTGLLCKLTQRSIVSAYLSEFEALANRIIGLLAPFVLSCFVSGLNPVIQREVQVMQPHSLVQAISFARLHEERMLVITAK